MARSLSRWHASRFAFLTLAGTLGLACTGEIWTLGDPGGEPGLPGASPSHPGSKSEGEAGGEGDSNAVAETLEFHCDPNARPPSEALRRLTMRQLENTLRDLLEARASQVAAAVLGEVSAQLAALPSDRREPTPEDLRGSYRRLDQSLQQLHVDAIYELGVKVGRALTRGERLGLVVGECAADDTPENDEACLAEFITTFGERALRRPLTEDDVAFYKKVYGSDPVATPEAYADVIGVMLNSPEFLYLVEHGEAEDPERPQVFRLSAYELASRLAYQLWQTAPDEELYAHAADGSLLEPSTYEKQVLRLIDDPRAERALSEFYEDWLKVTDLPALDAKVKDPVYRAFAGANLPDSTLRPAMIEDVLGLLDYYTWREPSPLGVLFTTEKSFAKSSALADIYGVDPWDGSSEPPSLPAGERPGLLTRALFLATGSPNTRPIMKGVFIRKHVLCDDIPPPPPGAAVKPPELSAEMTTREVIEELTEQSGTCIGCHANYINPLGFATENFDALGRYRTEQVLFDDEGNVLGSKPVNIRVRPRVRFEDDSVIESPAELMSLIAESGKVEACVARQFFRYTFARWEDEHLDACALEELRLALESGSLRELLSASVKTRTFQVRTFE